ncbi:MAG: SDR family NAD(P)-dependent oxidoreductase [Ignavibacteriales bacterium]
MELRSKCAVVTGGAMGIGLATARRLVKEGCTVTLWDINTEALDKAKVELEASGGKVYTHRCDVTDKNRVYELARIAEKEMERVDILINNAGFVSGGDILDRPDEDWEKTISINLTALIYTIRAFLPGMYERNSGHIVNISSAAGTLGVPGLAVYSATKWAVWGLTESLRLEAFNNKKPGVKYSSIHPSYIAHGMFQGAKLGFPGNLIVPLVKDHDVIARAIVESALRKERYSPKRPRSVNLNIRLRGLLPDSWFQRLMIIMGVTGSMQAWKGRARS